MKEAGIMVHVPYQGRPEALNDPMGGSIDVIVEAFAVVMHEIKAQAIKGRYRQPTAPDLPSFKEAGLLDVQLSGWPAAAAAGRHRAKTRQGCRRDRQMSGEAAAIARRPVRAGRPDANTFTAYHEVARWKKLTSEIGTSK
jgi:tripartite-type tricarboxylate transporter receptor subunit TctC